MAKRVVLLTLMINAVCWLGCGGSLQYPLQNQPGVVTQVALHPDPNLKRLYSVNYQQMGLIPICTPVEILDTSAKAVRFRAAGVEYQYLFAKQLRADKVAHLNEIFGTSCPDQSTLSAEDQAGIQAGRASVGMTRRGVYLALGVPPDHVNQPTGNVWKYWKNRFGTMDVVFNGDVVSEIKE